MNSVTTWKADLENTPTFDVVPVVHAYWEHGNGEWTNVLG